MLSISILKSIYNEHGLEELIKRIGNLLHIDLNVEDKDATITVTDDALRINTKNPIIISCDDEMYVVTTEYKTYKVIKYFYNGELLRSVTAFYTKDDQLLLIDHLDDGGFLSYRITKTTKDDKYFNQGYYERELSEYPAVPVNIHSYYIRRDKGEEEEKVVNVAEENLYYHHFSGEGNHYKEVAMCIDEPYLKIPGHIRVTEDLLLTSLKRPNPNIIITGIKTDEQDNPQSFYEVFFDVTPRGVIINDISLDYATQKIDRQTKRAFTRQTIINSNFINGLIRVLSNNEIIKKEHNSEVIEQLRKLLDINLEFERQKLRDINPLDLMMSIYPDPNRLALNVYENQARYEELVNEDLTKKL